MNNAKLSGLLGIALRANKIVFGEIAFEALTTNAKVLLISSDISAKSKERLVNRAKYYNVEYFVISDEIISKSLARENSKYLVVIDEGFSKGILDICRKRWRYG